MAYSSPWLSSVPMVAALVALGCGESSRGADNGHGSGGTTSRAGTDGSGMGGAPLSVGGAGGAVPATAGTGGAPPSPGGAGGAPPSASGGEGAAAGGTPAPDCTFEVPSPRAVSSPPSTVETDLEITCTDAEFGSFGLRVGAAPNTTYLAATSNQMAWVAEVGASTFVRHSLTTPDFARKVLEFALTPDGVPNLAIAGSGAVFFATLGSDGFVSEPVIAYDGYAKAPIDLVVDDQGRAALGIAHGGEVGSYSWLTRLGEGDWKLDPIPPPRRSSWVRFALDQDGVPVSFWYDAGQTNVAINGEQRVLDPTGARYLPVPYQAGGRGPKYAIVAQSDDALRALWFDGEETVAWPLPDTAKFATTCTPPGLTPTPCAPGSCHEDAVGVVSSAYAVDRATDGSVVIAYVLRRKDEDLTFEPGTCNIEVGCSCLVEVTRDASQDEVHVVRLAEDGSVEEVLVLETDDYREVLGDGTQMVERALDLDIQDDALALGVRTTSGMRVVRLSLDATH